MSKELSKRFNYNEREEEIYKLWEESGYFDPDNLPERHKEPFTIIMPPPNANDPLHIGHALFLTIEDIMTRYNRMQGKKALWLPGFDHAGFETQVVYDKKLEKQGRSRFQMEREDYYKEVWDYVQKNKDTAREQIKKLGASCDWNREKFTLDESVVKNSHKTFKKMYDDGLIYRGQRLVNYCTKHRTAFSDLEIEHEERKDNLYYIKYGPFTVATVRPETIFGDTAVAVSPKDKRYKKYIGKEVEVDFLIEKRKVKVIADDHVDPEFGTGALKVTPAHDANDYEIWLRHKDEIKGPIQVIGLDGKLNEKAGKYGGLKVEEARSKIVEDLEKAGLLEKIEEDYKHSVALCYKCKRIIEPMLMKQWFIKMEPLAKPAIEAAKSGELKFLPANQKKIYLHWLENIKDWNISRQNWWGIEIPAWKCLDCSKDDEVWVATEGEEPKKCPHCDSKKLERDPDVFDTWFSSGQWPYIALDYPDGEDFKTFYPTDIMETGYDILFFWVARMVMLGLYRTGKLPFKFVYLHGLVRDKDRQKMSKSKGNVIDPLGVIEEYGTDALRMALITGATIGRDPVISEEVIRGYRNFSTKLWNITRFIMMNVESYSAGKEYALTKDDAKIKDEFNKAAKSVTKNMDRMRYSQAAEDAYHYAWHTFADKVVEDSKEILNGEDEDKKMSRLSVLIGAWTGTLKLLHPFMPYITEELYQHLPLKDKNLLMVEPWPASNNTK